MNHKRPPPGRESLKTAQNKREARELLFRRESMTLCLSTISIVAHAPAKHKI